MKSTFRLRVLSDRMPRVLVFVYFCRGLSGIMEERATHRDYIEILTCRAIILHLEESKSHGNERETRRAQGQGALPPIGRPPCSVHQSQPTSRIMLHQPKGSRITLNPNSLFLKGEEASDQDQSHHINQTSRLAQLHRIRTRRSQSSIGFRNCQEDSW